MMTIKTPEQVKAEYRAKGIPLAHVAKENGWRAQDIYKVLNGVSRGNYGKPHEIAVFFGLIDAPSEHSQDNNSACDEVDLGIRSTDLTQMEQWFLSIYRSLNDEDRNTIERLLSLMDLENSWGDSNER